MMRFIFAGTPDFAAVALRRLVAEGHQARLVLTQPDRAVGRGLRSSASSVKALAQELELTVLQPASLKEPEVEAKLASVHADVGVAVAYGVILPPSVLGIPRLGWLNIHASLLPRWRGAAPIQRAIMAGDAETGVCIMQMEPGLDTGPVHLCERTPISESDTAGSLHDRLANLGADSVCRVLNLMESPARVPVPQSEVGVTYAHKITRADTYIRWDQPAAVIERQLRALDPAPGAYTEYQGEVLKLWRGAVCEGGSGPPGTVLASGPAGIRVNCGQDSLSILELQRAGGRRLPSDVFLRGCAIAAGARLGARDE